MSAAQRAPASLTPPGLRHLRSLALRVMLAQSGHFTLTDLCADFEISRKAGHKYLSRYAADGRSGFTPKWRSELCAKSTPGRRTYHRIPKLEKSLDPAMLINMNAAEIIQEITRLPDTEQGKVVEFVEALKITKQVRYVDSAVVEETADKVFREHAFCLNSSLSNGRAIVLARGRR